MGGLVERVFALRNEIVTFVAGYWEESKAGEFIYYLKDSFNLSICIKFKNRGPDAII